MTNGDLARSYLTRAQPRLKFLQLAFDDDGYPDVVRVAQEIMELALKAMLREAGVEPPRWHDVGSILREHRKRFPPNVDVERLAAISKLLTSERELAFYGREDFIPEREYTREQARQALDDAAWVMSVATDLIDKD